MNEHNITRITLRQYHASTSYNEEEALDKSHVDIATLQRLRAYGLIEGEETNGELRYSESEIIRLRLIRRLRHDLRINLAGIEVILRLRKRVEDLQHELEQEKWRPRNWYEVLQQQREMKSSRNDHIHGASVSLLDQNNDE